MRRQSEKNQGRLELTGHCLIVLAFAWFRSEIQKPVRARNDKHKQRHFSQKHTSLNVKRKKTSNLDLFDHLVVDTDLGCFTLTRSRRCFPGALPHLLHHVLLHALLQGPL